MNNMLILDGKKVRDEIMADLKNKIGELKIVPNLAIVKIGDNPDSDIYVRNKINFAKKIGVNAYVVSFSESDANKITQEMLLAGIEKLNKDESVNGIIVQSPLPSQLDWFEAVEKVAPEKDVDGMCHNSPFVPATARGVLSLLNYYKIPLVNKKACPSEVSERRRVVVMGRSKLVGGPIADLMIKKGAAVTVVHSQTQSPEKITHEADILIVAIGKPEHVGAEFVKEGAVVIDVGISTVINADGTKKILGDINFDSVSPIVSAISPVPGGVGPMTIASLFENLVEGCKKQNML